MSVDRTSDRPLYKQVADVLRTAVRSGELAEGQTLPSEAALMDRYGVSRNSARAAVALLRTEGLVVTEHGRGTYVRGRRPLRRLGWLEDADVAWESLTSDAGDGQPADDVGRALGAVVVMPPPEVASRLGLAPGEAALRRRVTVWEAGECVQRVDSYRRLPVPAAGGPQAAANPDEIMRRRGPIRDEVSVRMPTAAETGRGMSPASPVAQVLRTLHDHAGRPVEVCDLRLAGDQHILAYEVPATSD